MEAEKQIILDGSFNNRIRIQIKKMFADKVIVPVLRRLKNNPPVGARFVFATAPTNAKIISAAKRKSIAIANKMKNARKNAKSKEEVQGSPKENRKNEMGMGVRRKNINNQSKSTGGKKVPLALPEKKSRGGMTTGGKAPGNVKGPRDTEKSSSDEHSSEFEDVEDVPPLHRGPRDNRESSSDEHLPESDDD